jgi:tripartite ATP-independent transporter DctM subunit
MIATLIISFFLFLLLSIPVAFSLGAASVFGILIQHQIPLTAIPAKIYGGMDSFTLLAIPFFILAGELMDTGGIALRLIHLANALVGHLRGGLGMVVVVGEIFFSGISGSTTADAAAMGSIMIPSLTKSGYKPERAAAIVCAASGMGILVPPCLVMVIYGAMTNTSIAALFAAGFLPAFLMAVALIVQLYFQATKEGIQTIPRVPWNQKWIALEGASWALLMPIIIFGGILGGVFTPTEAAVVAVIYGLIAGKYIYQEMHWKDIAAIFARSGKTTGIVMFMVATANIFAWLLTLAQLPKIVIEFITSFAGGKILFLLFSNLAFILFGALLDGLPAMLMLIPFFFPIALKVGVDPIHFGIIVTANMGLALFLPPAGVGLFVTSGIARTSIAQVTRPLIPYLITIFVVTLIITYIPAIVMIVPKILGLL